MVLFYCNKAKFINLGTKQNFSAVKGMKKISANPDFLMTSNADAFCKPFHTNAKGEYEEDKHKA